MEKVILAVRKILIALLIIWMVTVFALSNQNGEESGSLSSKVAVMICFGNVEKAKEIEPMVRKGAHMFEYAVGAMLFYGYLSTYRKFSWQKKIVMTLAYIVVYAGLDEFHQRFIDERSGNLIDVGIDTFGGAMGIGASYLMEAIIRIIDKKVQEEVRNSSMVNVSK